MFLLPRFFGHSNKRSLVTWILLVITSAFIGYVLHIQIHFLTTLTTDSNEIFQLDARTDQNANLHKTVIISSYSKSGADIIADILGNRPDTFYTVDPLLSLGTPKYINDEDVVCSYFHDTCKQTSSAESYVKIMTGLLRCSNTDIFDETINPKWCGGGSVWIKYRNCLSDSTYNNELCYKYLGHQCLHAKNRVVKVDRISLQVLGAYLQQYDNVTVIHVFRDPRGIINEMIKGDKHTQNNVQSRLSNFASGLCSRMAADLEEGNKLTALYPKRFKMMLYEDFRFDMVAVTRPLFRFLGYTVTAPDLMFIDSLQGKKENPASSSVLVNADLDKNEILGTKGLETLPLKLNPFYWRKKLSGKNIIKIDSVCFDLYSKLGYSTYESEKNLRNMKDIPSYGGGGIYPF